MSLKAALSCYTSGTFINVPTPQRLPAANRILLLVLYVSKHSCCC
jgi:hypothetical protein